MAGQGRLARLGLIGGVLVMLGLVVGATQATQAPAPPPPLPAASDTAGLLNAFRRVEVASVSDAMEQMYGKRVYMSHRMRPLAFSGNRLAGTALTVLLKKEENSEGAPALQGMLTAIDEGAPDSVYVMVVEDGANIAGIGGLMGTAMHARGFAGAVIDGGVRDTAYLQRLGFLVYATGIVPSTSVKHYRFGGSNIPVTCDGVRVEPNDIIVGDNDGVAVIPRAQALDVLKAAQELDFKEHSTVPYIEKYKSIIKAVAQFGRI